MQSNQAEAAGPKLAASAVFTVYLHIHVASGRCYVGLTKLTTMKRWNQHVQNPRHKAGKGCRHFWNAIRKYGRDAFSHHALMVLPTVEEGNAWEEFWIDYFDSTDPRKGFNLKRGGDHTPHPIKNPWDRPGYRERNMAASKAALNTPESRARRSAASMKMWADPEFRERQSEIIKESNSRPEVREKMSAAQSGKTLSTEHRARISASSRCSDPEVRKKIAEATREAMARPEVQAKVSAGLRGRKHSPEHRAKISEAGRGRVLSEETRRKISESLKARRAVGSPHG